MNPFPSKVGLNNNRRNTTGTCPGESRPRLTCARGELLLNDNYEVYYPDFAFYIFTSFPSISTSRSNESSGAECSNCESSRCAGQGRHVCKYEHFDICIAGAGVSGERKYLRDG